MASNFFFSQFLFVDSRGKEWENVRRHCFTATICCISLQELRGYGIKEGACVESSCIDLMFELQA